MQRKTAGCKAEDADGLTSVKDDNAAASRFTLNFLQFFAELL